MPSTSSVAAVVAKFAAHPVNALVPGHNLSCLRALSDHKGAAMVEYALLAGLIALVAISAVSQVGTQIAATFSSLSDLL